MSEPSKPSGGTLGTFAGVFTPSILTILGIILFLRLGYVTGSAGCGRALIIIAIANLISILTSQSLAAIATNMRVKGGGDYYLISRTLGHRYGGAIGIVLYLAQSVSVAFYCIGFAEAISTMIALPPVISARLIAVAAVGLLFILAWLGADWATRFQYVVMALLAAALGSFFWGGLTQWEPGTLSSNWAAPADGPPFWVIFGIFFPAVTGFTQGVSMSGDLKDPGKSLPAGTFLAVGIAILIYFSVAIVFAGVLPNHVMMSDYQSIKKVARFGGLIDAGVISATLSSAMASFLGGPRILQSLAADRIFPFLLPFAKGSGATANPRRAVLLTMVIALSTIALGQLNIVARVVSMFFLISYGLLNYATYFEARAASPSFRPRFRWFNKYLSLLGFIICLGVILALDVQYGIIAVAILTAIYHYLKHTAGPSRWADSSAAHAFQVIREQLHLMAGSPAHHRNWRPHMLVFSNHAERRVPLLTFAQWIEGDSGLVTVARIIEGPASQTRKFRRQAEEELTRHIAEHHFKAFPLVVGTEDIASAIPLLLQSYGVGPLHANMVLVNWYGQSAVGIQGLQALKYGQHLTAAFRQGFNLVVLHYDDTRWVTLKQLPDEDRRIDLWWRADATSHLMLLLAYLVTRNDGWRKARIRVLTTGTGERITEAKKELIQELEDVRIDAQVKVVADLSPDTVVTESSRSSLVFLPFRIHRFKLTDTEGLSLQRLLPRLPMTALVMAAEDIDLNAEPEEGAAGELADAMDALHAAEQKKDHSEKEISKLQATVEKLKSELEAALSSDSANDEMVRHWPQKIKDAEKTAEEAFRRHAKLKAKAEDAAKLVVQLGGPMEEKSESSSESE